MLPLSKSAIKWIKECVEEGDKPVYAMAWISRNRKNHTAALYAALIFRREIAPIWPTRLLVS